ncbi:MAG: TetR/AcrR family transcriptional regulator [Anaerolineales bacterium]|nr:TetR/AcrR family transcriptional regulator [Anaerolineales bacterium]MCB8953645.1 TetR/AcrR family transcriptional regulator [Ardenticatenales bacterium]
MSGKRKHDPDEKRAKILSSALDLFLEKGFDGVSMNAIARHSGVTQSLIHHYFGSKQELWQAVKSHTYSDYLAHQQQILDQDDGRPTPFVRNALRSRFDFFQQNPHVVRLLSWLQLMEDPTGMETGQEIGRQMLARIRQAQANASIRADVPAETILAMALALTTHWFQSRHVIQHFANMDDTPPAQADAEYLEAMITVFLDGLRPPSNTN